MLAYNIFFIQLVILYSVIFFNRNHINKDATKGILFLVATFVLIICNKVLTVDMGFISELNFFFYQFTLKPPISREIYRQIINYQPYLQIIAAVISTIIVTSYTHKFIKKQLLNINYNLYFPLSIRINWLLLISSLLPFILRWFLPSEYLFSQSWIMMSTFQLVISGLLSVYFYTNFKKKYEYSNKLSFLGGLLAALLILQFLYLINKWLGIIIMNPNLKLGLSTAAFLRNIITLFLSFHLFRFVMIR